MSDDKIQTTGLYVVRLVQHLNDMQYYIETHRILETANPISNIDKYCMEPESIGKGFLDRKEALKELRAYKIPESCETVVRDEIDRNEIYYINKSEFKEYQKERSLRNDSISQNDFIREVFTRFGRNPNGWR